MKCKFHRKSQIKIYVNILLNFIFLCPQKRGKIKEKEDSKRENIKETAIIKELSVLLYLKQN